MAVEKVVDENTEMLALATICANNKSGRYLQTKLNNEHFGWEPTAQAYHRVRTYFMEHMRVLTWRELIHDPILNQDNRQLLMNFTNQPANNPIPIINTLDDYRKLRQYWRINEIVNYTLFGPEQTIDLDGLGKKIADLITKARSSGLRDHIFTHIGIDSNIKTVVQKMLAEDNTYIPTGFKTFDNRSYGLPRGEVFLVTSHTGSLKTLLMYQIAMNMATYGAKVCYIPLEMNERQMMRRHIANIAHIPLVKLLQAKNLNQQERNNLWMSLQQYESRLKRINSRLSILTPDTDISVADALTLVQPYAFDAVFMDYISLFKDADDERQWQRLGQAVRFAKIWAEHTNTLVGIAAQLNEEDRVRYSRAMAEHASNQWRWKYDQIARETGIITIEQPKSRNQWDFSFELKVEPEYMKARDLTQEEYNLLQQMRKVSAKSKPNGSGKQPIDLEETYYS